MADLDASTSSMEDEDVHNCDSWDRSYNSMKDSKSIQENCEREEFKGEQELRYLELNEKKTDN